MIESNACGSQSILRESLGGGALSCWSTSPIDVVAVNGGEPVINSKAVHANAYSSVAADGACPCSSSGAEYGSDASMCAGLRPTSSATACATPKSISTAPNTEKDSETRILD